MRKIILISCVSKKLSHKAKAKDLYISPLFRLNLKYARRLNPDVIYILSAKYGLLDLNTEIEPYDVTLNKMSSEQRRAWAHTVMEQLKNHADFKRDHFIFLAGQNYRKYLISGMASYEVPLEGLPIGKQLKFLSKKVSQ